MPKAAGRGSGAANAGAASDKVTIEKTARRLSIDDPSQTDAAVALRIDETSIALRSLSQD
jgi:hypothetical protein